MSTDTSSLELVQALSGLALDGKRATESRQVSGSALEFLLPELVSTLVSTTLKTMTTAERLSLGFDTDSAIAEQPGELAKEMETDSAATSGWLEPSNNNNELLERVYVKLESVGFRVGKRLAERFAPMSRRLSDTLDIVKFVCKDLWMLLFNRQIDNLKTNHRGVYVLQDNKFKWFLHMSGNNGGAGAARRAQPYIWFPCGIIRGILDGFGISTVVVAETLGLPQCTFQIRVVSDE